MASEDTKNRVKKNKIISTKVFYTLLFFVIIAIVGIVSKYVYIFKTDEYKQNIYKKINLDTIEHFKVMLNENLSTSLLISSSLSQNYTIKQALLNKEPELLDIDKILEQMRTKQEYIDIQAEVIDAKGICFKRSWTDERGDDLVKNNSKIEHLIKYPAVDTGIESTKYGMTISNKIPIYNKDKFLGYFGVNFPFDAIVNYFAKQGDKIIILMNPKDSKKIQQEVSYSKNFIGNRYVVNANADEYLLRVCRQSNIKNFYNQEKKQLLVDEQVGQLISKYDIKDADGKILANVLMFKSIDEIDFDDLGLFQKLQVITTGFLVLLMLFLVKYFYMATAYKEKSVENDKLTIVNKELEDKQDDMDFNEKKLENLFNMQPNLMFMHNGKEITKANQRFMGFFNRFGTFEGFREKHKCVSELFEKYEAPNYIWEQNIEGEFWIDYLLKNPRRLYKVVMSIKGDPHHFIVKFNEMEYSKYVTDRVIIVALVDMTQDLVNYKTLEKTTDSLKAIANTKKLVPKIEQKSKDATNKKDENLKVEQKPKDISTKKEEKPKVEEKPKEKQEVKKIDPYALIQNSVAVVLSEMLDTKIQFTKEQQVNAILLKDTKGVFFYNSLVLNDSNNIDLGFFVPAQTLSKIFNIMIDDPSGDIVDIVDEGLLDISKQMIVVLTNTIQEKTQKHIQLVSKQSKTIEGLESIEKTNVIEIGIVFNNKRLPLYMVLNNKEISK